VRRDQQLTPDTFGRLNSAFRDRAKTLAGPLFQMAATLSRNPAKLDPVILLEEHQREVLGFFDRQIQYFEEILAARRLESQSDPDNPARARQDAALLPKAPHRFSGRAFTNPFVPSLKIKQNMRNSPESSNGPRGGFTAKNIFFAQNKANPKPVPRCFQWN